MAVGAMKFFYRRLGAHYPLAFLAIELQSALFIVAGTLALFTFYFDASLGEYLGVLAIGVVLTEVAILIAVLRARPQVAPIRDWIGGERDEESSSRAWNAAVGLPLSLIRHDLPVPVLVSVLPICIASVAILDLSWLAFFPLLAGSAVALGYSAILHYLAVEAGMRPVLVEINSAITPRTSTRRGRRAAALAADDRAAADQPDHRPRRRGADLRRQRRRRQPRRRRDGRARGRDDDLARAHGDALEVDPAAARRPLARRSSRVNEGDFTASVPVTTGDELGDLAASFNEMTAGLREREKIREAFGTYLDREIAEYILSEGFAEEGVEVDVSILFCDVRDFTRFAADATPTEVVAALNGLFEVIVPIIAEHGGHVDKFEGDGLLAVFGAPEPFPDHADRAVRAACRIADAVNERDVAGELRIGVGVNSGRVVAGAIGGAGRLNFSSSAAPSTSPPGSRRRPATLDDSILVTGETWKRLGHEFERRQPRQGRS